MHRFLKRVICLITSLVIVSYSFIPFVSSADTVDIDITETDWILGLPTDYDGITYPTQDGLYYKNYILLENHSTSPYELLVIPYSDTLYFTDDGSKYSFNTDIVKQGITYKWNITYWKNNGGSFWGYEYPYGTELYYQLVTTDYNSNADNILLQNGINAKKTTGSNLISSLKDGLKGLLTGGLDLSLFGSLVDRFELLGNSFNDWFGGTLSSSLGFDVSVGDETYNEILTDLTNNTITSSYWSQIDDSITNQIRQTYSNLQQCFDNSVSVYNDDDNNNYYTPNTTTSTSNNYSTYEGDTINYFNTYVLADSSSGGGDVTTSPSSGDSSDGGGGAYAYASAEANANASVGDIIINNNGGNNGSGGGSNDTSSDDVDISNFENLLNSCKNFWEFLKNAFVVFPYELWLCFGCLFTVAVICRILGR